MQSKKILIVEDQNDLRVTLELGIEHLGHEPMCVADGSDALEKLIRKQIDNEPIDLLLYDTQVSGMIGAYQSSISGVHFIETMREIKISTPVLAITDYGDRDVMARLMQLGCTDFIDKPFTSDEVEQQVRRLLDKTNPREADEQCSKFWAAISERARLPNSAG